MFFMEIEKESREDGNFASISVALKEVREIWCVLNSSLGTRFVLSNFSSATRNQVLQKTEGNDVAQRFLGQLDELAQASWIFFFRFF